MWRSYLPPNFTATRKGAASTNDRKLEPWAGRDRDVMKRLLQETEAATGDSADFARSITEAGYWWRYQSAPDHPDEAITLMIHIAKVIADAEAHNTGRVYLVGRAALAVNAIYAFASDHPDARNAAINIMYDCPPAGKPARRAAPRTTRH
jgi:hypothetical protein